MYNRDMAKNGAPAIFKLLSNDLRWNILNLLSQSDLRVQEIAEALRQPQNLVSYHLQKLTDQGLISVHHSIADGREVYYGINLNQIRAVFQETEESLHPGLVAEKDHQRSIPPVRVLFLCTHNSARSQMAEGFLKAKSRHQMQVFSGGTDPASLNPLAIQVMDAYHIDIRDQQSKSLYQFVDQSFDYIITVCDRARETCPFFPGNPVKIHWSIADPTAVQGTAQDRLHAFQSTAKELDERTDSLLAGVSGQWFMDMGK